MPGSKNVHFSAGLFGLMLRRLFSSIWLGTCVVQSRGRFVTTTTGSRLRTNRIIMRGLHQLPESDAADQARLSLPHSSSASRLPAGQDAK
jgi:hypothetical protein